MTILYLYQNRISKDVNGVSRISMLLQRRNRILSALYSSHWRCFTLLLTLIMVITYFQFAPSSVKESPFLKHSNGKNREGPDPLHVLLVSYARTGSSFTGDLLQNLPDAFYYYEPLHFLNRHVLHSGFTEARAYLHDLFLCNASKVQQFFQWLKSSDMLKNRNLLYLDDCTKANACLNGTYFDSYCRRHSTVVVKSIRLSLREAAKLLTEYPDLNLKIIYLFRDPRATINSRMKYPVVLWCKNESDCHDTKVFCSTLVDDMELICSLYDERPRDFIAVRYEELATNPFTVTDRLMKFLGFPTMPSEIEDFLKTHTSFTGSMDEKAKEMKSEPSYLTFRNSLTTAMAWRNKMNFEQVMNIQRDCKTVLEGMGCHSYASLQSLRSNLNLDISLDEALNSTCSSKYGHHLI